MADDVSTAGLNLQKRRLASVHVHSVPHKLMMVRPKQKLNHLRGAVAERVTNSACAVKLEGKSGDKRRMKVIQPNCRVQFTAEDIDFIQAVLGAKAGQGECLVQLLADEECRDLILDDAALFHALLERSGCLRVSSHFYFYVLVRHVLRRAGVEDRAVADYVAEVLAEFSRIDRTRCIIPGQTGTLDYFFEMLAALRTADERTRFYIRAHIGNHSLFLSGIFPERIRYRTESRGFPDLKYYEALGESNFRLASDHRLAARYDLGSVFSTLAERFQTTRQALNDLTDRLLSIGDLDLPSEVSWRGAADSSD